MESTNDYQDMVIMLAGIENYASKHPHLIAKMQQAIQTGVENRITEERERAIDMETIAITLVQKRFRHEEQFIKQKIKKWAHRNSFNWDWFLKSEE